MSLINQEHGVKMESKEKATILVVDDQVDIRILSKRILEGNGYRVIMAEDGMIALNKLSEQNVDLIIADIAMPNLNGYQLFERVSNNTDWANVPFILLSARDLDSDVRYGKSLGVDDYITKPFDPADLLSSVRGRLLRAEQLADCMENTETFKTNCVFENMKPSTIKTMEEPVISIDTRRQLIKKHGYEIKLSAREFRLLLLLHDNQNRVVPVQELIGVTHGYSTTRKQASNLLRPLIRSIRRKLGYEVGENGCIRNVRGIGYQYIEYGHTGSPAAAG
jgi:DNA-binding response OmpR family regulator